MPMTQGHQTLSNNQVAAAAVLDEKIVTFLTARQAQLAAAAALETATAAVDAAWVDFKAKSTAFSSAMLTPPDGYTPPA